MTELEPVEICATLTATVSREEAVDLIRYFNTWRDKTERDLKWSMNVTDKAT